eukprot:COSAG06_NODE_76961_length_118_cov_48.157895_1_plen_39_part_11
MAAARAHFADLLPEYMIQTGGQILLGCPVGPDQASVHVG